MNQLGKVKCGVDIRCAAILTILAVALGPHLHAAGALAIDTRQGDQWGWAANEPSESEAKSRALRECGSGCRVVMTFSGSCADTSWHHWRLANRVN